MYKIAIFTTTRADFGIFTPLLNYIKKNQYFDYKLFVGGTHLSTKHGNTISEIKDNGFIITDYFDALPKNDSEKEIIKATAKASEKLSEIFSKHNFNFVCVLGDRHELLSIVEAAIVFRKPIVHIHGGEVTQGAIDEQIRHMVTKSAHIHFVVANEYFENVRRMGEEQWRIFNTGSLAVENMMSIETGR